MKEKTSITLSREVLKAVERVAGPKQSRSAFIETVLRRHLLEQARTQRDKHELEILNRKADRLNREAEDGLELQSPEG
jgi:metal-responsive CopG/Arc/MetJ family transcriptional regulator